MNTLAKNLHALGTLERPTAGLDARSAITLEWCQHWASIRTRIRPQPAVVLRRALELYERHLSQLPDPEQGTEYWSDEPAMSERRALEVAAKGSGSARSLTEARARLEAAGSRPVAFLDVLHSPEARQLTASINAAVAASTKT